MGTLLARSSLGQLADSAVQLTEIAGKGGALLPFFVAQIYAPRAIPQPLRWLRGKMQTAAALEEPGGAKTDVHPP